MGIPNYHLALNPAQFNLNAIKYNTMEKIKITIYDDLSPFQELQEINKQLLKLLPSAKKQQKLIGDHITIKHLESQITIVREPRIRHITLLKCHCGIEFQKNKAKRLYTNYGGIKKTLYYCSDNCRDIIAQICGNRASINSKELKPAYLY